MCVGTCGSLSRRGGKCFQRSHFIFHPFDSFGFKLIKKATRLLRVVFLWYHQRESLRFAVRIGRTKTTFCMCVGTCGSLSRRGGKCFQRSHFIFCPFDSFGFKLIKKATRLLRVVFLWHHQRESLRFAVRIVRTKNCVLHVRWHMRLALTPGRKMLPKVAFYIPPVRFLWV